MILIEYVIDVISRLLGHLDVFWASRCVFHNVIRATENTHQTRQHRLDSVAHVHRLRSAAALFFISQGLAGIVFRCDCSLGRYRVVNEIDGIFDGERDGGLDLFCVHAHVFFDEFVVVV